jgi:hypothetical protein
MNAARIMPFAMSRVHGSHEVWQPQNQVDRDAVLRELEAVLASSHFCNSKRYPAFLSYVVEHALAGRTEQLKERTLGIEVFDRAPNFDTNSDTVVRYTAGEVRKRLLLYYSEHPHQSAIRISLPAGSYIPEFTPEHSNADGAATEHEHSHLQAEPGSDPEHSGGSLHHTRAVREPAEQQQAPRQSKSRRITAGWALGTIGLVLIALAVAGFVSWKSRRIPQATLVDSFWAPVLHDQRTVIVCTGSVVFANNNNYSGVITAGKNIDYSFVSFQNASAIAQVSSVLARSGMAMQMVSAPSTPLTDLSGHAVVLLGGYNNPWTLRLIEPLRFHFSPPTAADETILDREHPDAQWTRDRSLPYSSADDYAIVARFLDPTTGGWIVAVAGVGRNGTEAAAQFITSPHYLQQLRDRLGSDFQNHNVEAILKVSVIDGKTGAPSILAVHSWR